MPSPATWLLLAALCSSSVAASAGDAAPSPASLVATDAPGELLKASETADPKKVDIVKQIRRLNDDGSYTVGYEAGDGTFKIESRDVLGNVKGTFGYVDEAGEIKRVTYSSSNSSTPAPLAVGAAAMTPSAGPGTARRPLPTVVYPRAGTPPTPRGTVIQPIPRKRPSSPASPSGRELPERTETTTSDSSDSATRTMSNVYKPKLDESFMKPIKSQLMKPATDSPAMEMLQTRHTSTEPSARIVQTVKPVQEPTGAREVEKQSPKANQFRRQLPGSSRDNLHMLNLQQSIGEDSSDVYGSHRSLGTVRPLFTTTTVRPRLAPFTSILAARHKLQDHIDRYPPAEEIHRETAEDAYDRNSGVTSSPIPALHVPSHRDRGDETLYNQPIYRRPYVQFRTTDYLRDNPGSPIPIGNQRAYFDYELRARRPETGQLFYSESGAAPPTGSSGSAPPEAATPTPYALAPVTRIIPIAVDERGVPIPGYRFAVNPFEASPPPRRQPPPQEFAPDNMQTITTPVSTRDLKRLLHVLLLRQNRLQALMDDIAGAGPPYGTLQPYAAEAGAPRRQYEPDYRSLDVQRRQYRPPPPPERQYEYDPSYSERHSAHDERQRLAHQRELYTNQISGYEPSAQYESRRFVPRRRAQYDADAASSGGGGGGGEYLPADVREALLLKMLMLAISPEYMPRPPAYPAAAAAPPTELTTAAPLHRKQVRNVQILGEEGSKDEAERRRSTAAAAPGAARARSH